jgi:hypothetical protein
MHALFHLGGVMVSVLVIGPKVRGFKFGQGYGFLRAIKIRRTRSFGREIALETACHKILRHVKDLYDYERDIS